MQRSAETNPSANTNTNTVADTNTHPNPISISGSINIGFEPGEQAAGGAWEGLEADKQFAKFALDKGFGGAMIWAANPNPLQAPTGSTLCPQTAAAVAEIIKPQYAWGAAKWTKCTSSGWWPSLETTLV